MNVFSHGSIGELKAEIFNGQRPPESYGKRAAERIISISQGTHPVIRDQANDFKNRIEAVVTAIVKQALEEERAYARLKHGE